MAFTYHVLLTVAKGNRTDTEVMDLVQRARLQAGAREPIYGAIRGAHEDDTGSEPGTVASFYVVASDDTEVQRVLTTMGEWLEGREQAAVLRPPRIVRKRAVEPMSIEGPGLHYDADTGLLTVQPDAGPVEVQLLKPHETEPGDRRHCLHRASRLGPDGAIAAGAAHRHHAAVAGSVGWQCRRPQPCWHQRRSRSRTRKFSTNC